MAIYLVGDVQGCYNELIALLNQVDFQPNKDVLYLAGDLVARGPDSLETLRFVKALGNSAKVVLGNHDLHLLAVHAGIKKAKKSDLINELLTAPDIKELMNWLAQQPVIQEIPDEKYDNKTGPNKAIKTNSGYMTHAGVSPQWTLAEALEQANYIHKKLSSKNRNHWLACMYGEKPNDWQQAITNEDKFRYSINAFSRMRYCNVDGTLEFNEKNSPDKVKNTLIQPWYTLSPTINNTTWVFGHWAALMGVTPHKNIYALDTGCDWGNHLTMLRWHDKKHFIQPALSRSN